MGDGFISCIKWALEWAGQKKWKLILAVSLVFISICIMIIEPFIFKIIIDEVLGKHEYEKLIPLLAAAIGVGVTYMLMKYIISILCEQASQHAIFDLKSDLFKRLLPQTNEFYQTHRAGDLITNMTGDIDLIRHFLSWVIPKWAECIFMIVIVLTVFISISPLYALCLFALTPFTVIFAIQLAKNVRPAYTEARNQLSILNTVVQENISGNRVVKAFAREDFEIEKFSKENNEYKARNIRANSIWLKYNPLIESISNLLSIVNLVVGGIMVISGKISLGQLNIFLSLAWALNDPMVLVGFVVNDTQRFLASAEKVMALYYTENKIVDADNANEAETLKGNIVFKNVTLKYGKIKVLDDISFEIKPGEIVGFMGPTGGGKTSLVSLISRFIDVTSGSVSIDNIDVKQYTLQSLRRNIALTMQDVFLFSDTIESNIAYGVPEASMDEVYAAANCADADSFISNMPDGYDTIVGERGTGLSGGQKQRIS
ncbi:MAG: ABC transporter ATP-binding protein, partial [Bacillota bacterium]|nr:ABC transporter ATP-binding protein [Bacillota bacterium]